MILKKFLLLPFCFLFVVNVKAQTLAETISWLNNKFEKFSKNQQNCKMSGGGYKLQLIQYSAKIESNTNDLASSQLVVYACHTVDDNDNCIGTMTSKVYLKDIMNVKAINGCDEKIRLMIFGDLHPEYSGTSRHFPNEMQEVALMLNWDGEADLLQRITKAFNRLIELNKSEEPF